MRKLAVAAILTPEWTRWPRRSRAGGGQFAPSLVAGDDVARLKLDAVAVYATQWRLFYRSLDDWRVALERYARAMGQRRHGRARLARGRSSTASGPLSATVGIGS